MISELVPIILTLFVIVIVFVILRKPNNPRDSAQIRQIWDDIAGEFGLHFDREAMELQGRHRDYSVLMRLQRRTSKQEDEQHRRDAGAGVEIIVDLRERSRSDLTIDPISSYDARVNINAPATERGEYVIDDGFRIEYLPLGEAKSLILSPEAYTLLREALSEADDLSVTAGSLRALVSRADNPAIIRRQLSIIVQTARALDESDLILAFEDSTYPFAIQLGIFGPPTRLHLRVILGSTWLDDLASLASTARHAESTKSASSNLRAFKKAFEESPLTEIDLSSTVPGTEASTALLKLHRICDAVEIKEDGLQLTGAFEQFSSEEIERWIDVRLRIIHDLYELLPENVW